MEARRPSKLSALLLLLLLPAVDARGWAAIFDAGSTGTRVHIYSWAGSTDSGLPDVRAEPGGNMKVKPGISTFDGRPEQAGDSIQPLIKLATRLVPVEAQRAATVLLRATAGMRLLPRRRAQRIYEALVGAVNTNSGFAPTHDSFGTLPGDDEGVFGWLSANFLISTDQSRAARPVFGSVGALDLGGASTQITMPTTKGAPNTVAVPMPAGQSAASVFTHSHLGFGNMQAKQLLTAKEASACLNAGAVASWEAAGNASGGPTTLSGRGSFAECEAGIRRVLSGFERSGQPPPARGQKFVAMSLFFYAVNFAKNAGHLAATPSPSPRAMLTAARGLCGEDAASLRRMVGKDPYTPEEAIQWRCFDLLYAARLLSDGYGFDVDAESVEFLGDVGGVEVEWTLGALLHSLLSKTAPPKPPTPSSVADKLGAIALLAIIVAVCHCWRKHPHAAKRAYQPVLHVAREV